MIDFERNFAISAVLKPASDSTASVCSAKAGGRGNKRGRPGTSTAARGRRRVVPATAVRFGREGIAGMVRTAAQSLISVQAILAVDKAGSSDVFISRKAVVVASGS